MTVRINKPALNVREELSKLNKPSGVAGEAMLRAETPQEQFNLIGAGRKNLIINGGFDVWQRGTSWTSATNGQYTVDRWQTFGSSMTCNIDRSTDVPANQGFKYSVKVVRTANGLPFLRQLIEDFDTVVVGRDWTASFWAKADTACTISVDLGDTGSTTVSIGTSWEKHTVYFPSTLTPTYAALDFQSNSSDTPMYFTGVQLELGSVATPFEHRSYGEELALCQRFYCKSFPDGVTPSNGSASALYTEAGAFNGRTSNSEGGQQVYFPVTMRTTPTIIGYGNSSGYWYANGTWHVNAFGYRNNSNNGFTVSQQTVGGYSYTKGHWAADAEL